VHNKISDQDSVSADIQYSMTWIRDTKKLDRDIPTLNKLLIYYI